MTVELTGKIFVEMVKSGAANLDKNKKIVNDLNVFPVPDGDTGDNMAMTIRAAAEDEKLVDIYSLEKSADLVAKAMLLGARGNSGVILSRIFAGISSALNGETTANLQKWHNALSKGVEEAYLAVTHPVEGTILSVFKDAVRMAGGCATNNATFEEYFEVFLNEIHESINRTPELLPKLAEAGVVDSGGVGLCYIFEGMRDALVGNAAEFEHSNSVAEKSDLDISLFTESSELEFGYCTEFLLRLQSKKVDIAKFDIDEFKKFLIENGDSVVAFCDGSIVKAHVHTKTPGKILDYCQKFGEFLKMKIENMTLQHNGASIRNSFEPIIKKVQKNFGIVTVANGKGLVDTFKSLGCDAVIDGGQSMNPSTNDFLEAFKKTNAKFIFVFPNNKNIIMAANQAKKIYDEAEIVIIETKTIGEGYAAISMFDEASGDAEKITEELNAAKENVKTGMISRASRKTKVGELEISENDFIGFTDGEILVSGKNREKVFDDLCEKLSAKDSDVLIIAFGKDVNEKEATELKARIEQKAPLTEVILLNGGQPIYDYILIFE